MGGGMGGMGISPDQLRTIEERAKRTIRDGDSSRHNVFISFSYEDLKEVNLLRGQAKNENSEIEFNDWSLKEPFDSTKADYIKRGIRERIRQSSITIVYLSDSTASSRWVNWEIQESINMGKKVLAMHKGDSPPRVLPKAIIDNGVSIVPWNHKEISKTINND